MAKYEIMMIVDPKADVNVAFDLLKEVFGNGVKKAEKLAINELSYSINKSKHAQYVNAEVESKPELISEFVRRSNIVKQVWRQLVINLDTESGLKPANTKKATKKVVRKSTPRKVAPKTEE
ncbi:30S ribosomal protein S6 [Mycoplasma anserisalpingitidis]|uniref:30S ribosomal protein S6 n=1 Tax=Mycoplasma anserisalpingitidis TaxID=519450 RepID=UPI0011B1B961|nr:30S ribosomal protein S6 [Mycoplasma anserisalpingitidis]QDY88035.1 30S ribosomal protein S6 [Mycoplasma anserisalpingitidis]UCU26985.1 30S ribosomal protein S6 [Mycoplasma anserisalpingitidis]UCU27112.1 30S ribosomal protein S6 [Mycoplasma anserisalpingitidis]